MARRKSGAHDIFHDRKCKSCPASGCPYVGKNKKPKQKYCRKYKRAKYIAELANQLAGSVT